MMIQTGSRWWLGDQRAVCKVDALCWRFLVEIRQEIVYHTHIVHKQKNTVQSGVSLLHVMNFSTRVRDEEEVR